MADLEAIRARCAQSVTEIVASPSEYFRVQQILRDRQDLLALVDETQNSASDLVEEVVALSVRNERIEKALRRALDLLRIGMDVGMEPHEKDEANALCVLFGEGKSFTKSLHEIIGVDMARGPDQTVEVHWRDGPKPYCKCSLNGQRWLPEECPIHRPSDPT